MALTHEEIWRKYDAIESRLSAGLSERMLDLARLQQGMRLLDVASGRGEPAIRAAKRVGLEGYVLGIDPQEPLLAMAREQYALPNLELRAIDAEELALPDVSFDAATCRWGLMYMNAPLTVLENIRRVLRPGAPFVAAFWAEPERVPYFTFPRKLYETYRPLPPIDFDAPGVFRYARLESIERDYAAVGLEIEHIEELDVPVIEGTAEEIVEWTRIFGMKRLLDELPEAEQQAWQERMIAQVPRSLGGITRVVVARNN